jgi:hypothetical protein
MKFRRGNQYLYGQDFRFFHGVPSGVDFAVESASEQSYKLTACGYGCLERHTPECYGNGSLHVYPDIRLRKRLDQAISEQAEATHDTAHRD